MRIFQFRVKYMSKYVLSYFRLLLYNNKYMPDNRTLLYYWDPNEDLDYLSDYTAFQENDKISNSIIWKESLWKMSNKYNKMSNYKRNMDK